MSEWLRPLPWLLWGWLHSDLLQLLHYCQYQLNMLQTHYWCFLRGLQPSYFCQEISANASFEIEALADWFVSLVQPRLPVLICPLIGHRACGKGESLQHQSPRLSSTIKEVESGVWSQEKLLNIWEFQGTVVVEIVMEFWSKFVRSSKVSYNSRGPWSCPFCLLVPNLMLLLLLVPHWFSCLIVLILWFHAFTYTNIES